MKKVYETPIFEYDSYELDEFVANCANTTPNHSKATCGVDIGGILLFDMDIGKACEADESELVGDEKDHDGYCYHIPVSEMQYFGS